MPDINVILPSKPKVISEKEWKGVYEIEGLYPGYGHTLGNSLRRIILSSLPGAAITSVKISGVSHEFSTIAGVKEDVVTILLNLKKLRFKMTGDGVQKAYIRTNKVGPVVSGDIEIPGQLELFSKDQRIAEITDKNTKLEIELTIEKGIGYVPKEVHHKEKIDIGTIPLDAVFTPIRRANYEVENMRVGDRTDFNRLKLFIETDGVITPREALEKSIEIMITQLKAVIGFQEERIEEDKEERAQEGSGPKDEGEEKDSLKTKIEDLDLSARTMNALTKASIRTVGGLARKSEADLLELDGLGDKGIGEIRRALGQFGITLKDN